MAPRIPTHQRPLTRPSRTRSFFYPGEVARMLGLEGVDYYQLRRLFRLVREQSSSASPDAQPLCFFRAEASFRSSSESFFQAREDRAASGPRRDSGLRF